MAALPYLGKGLIAAVQATKLLSLYPVSGSVVADTLDALAGFERTTGSIHHLVEHQLPDDLVRRILQARRAEIDARLR